MPNPKWPPHTRNASYVFSLCLHYYYYASQQELVITNQIFTYFRACICHKEYTPTMDKLCLYPCTILSVRQTPTGPPVLKRRCTAREKSLRNEIQAENECINTKRLPTHCRSNRYSTTNQSISPWAKKEAQLNSNGDTERDIRNVSNGDTERD